MMQNSEEKIYTESMNEIFSFQINTCEILESLMLELKSKLPLDVFNFFEFNLKNITKTIRIYFENIVKYSDNFYLISEATSAARMVFESITSLLYLLKSENFKAYYDYCYKTKELDEQTLKDIKEFLGSHQLNSDNKKPMILLNKLETDISRIANYLKHLKVELNVNKHSRFPKVNQRCKDLGVYWEFEYLSTYRMMSNHLHGNVKSMHHDILKQTNSKNNSNEKYNVNLHLTWISSTLGQFLEEISEFFSFRKYTDQYAILKQAHTYKLDKLYSSSTLNLTRT